MVSPQSLHEFDAAAGELAARTARYVEDRARHLYERLGPPPAATELDAKLAGAITPDGLGFACAFDLFTDVVMPNSLTPEHPRFLAFVSYAPAVGAVLFDSALSAAGMFGTSWLEGAGAAAAENQALRWLANLAGLPPGAGGTFLSGGTVANVNGLAVARHWWRTAHGDSRRRLAVATSAEVHSSVRLAAKMLELDVVDVPVDRRGLLQGEKLAEVLDRAEAEVCAVATTAGITNLGLVDDLVGIARVTKERGLWLHVDGAYGGAALVSPSARPLFAGIELADSLVIDPHKWLFSPLDSSALIYREPAWARAAFTQTASYLDPFQVSGEVNPGDLAAHLTRRARGLPFWFTLAAYGIDAITAAIEHGIALAKQSARLIDERAYLELMVEPELSVVVFRRRGWDPADYHAWSDRLLLEGEALVLPTSWHGETLMRFCFINPRTTLADVKFLLDRLAE
jgi:L-2,4-diaminobutyrate decarboxylase